METCWLDIISAVVHIIFLISYVLLTLHVMHLRNKVDTFERERYQFKKEIASLEYKVIIFEHEINSILKKPEDRIVEDKSHEKAEKGRDYAG